MAASLALASCMTTPRDVFTEAEQAVAEVPGLPNVRTWGDGPLEDFQGRGLEPARRQARTISILALSGGGSGGAFGAGLLAGWSASGRRPSFDLVSGVSTGALIAPFAFLGPDYDDELTFLYTSGVTNDLMQPRPLPNGLLGSGLYRAEPLRKLVETYATPALLKQIAAEHAKGRRLVVVTTNLDAQRPVVWDLGKIAASSDLGAMKLFQDVLVASASIPAVFPPVLIETVSGRRRIQELHSDGATATQVFTVPEALLAGAVGPTVPDGVEANLYVIVNNALMPEFDFVSNSTFGVGGRALSTMIKSQTRGSINATAAFVRRAGVGYHLASIDEAVPYDPTNPFDLGYMRRLYKLGFERATGGQLWNSEGKDRASLRLAKAK